MAANASRPVRVHDLGRQRRDRPFRRQAARTSSGRSRPTQLAALESAIKLTDFALLKSRPFTGECPTNFDGQEFIFEFAAPGGVERIATCEVDVDYALPLFVAVVDGARAVHAAADDLTRFEASASASAFSTRLRASSRPRM